MAPFSPNRKYHRATPASITGELPTAALLCGVPVGKDGGDRGHASQEELGYNNIKFMWAGCLDAPDTIATGGHRAVVIDGCYEGTVTTLIFR